MKTHYIAVIGTDYVQAACGLWQPPNVTGELKAVTCNSCRRSHSYIIAVCRPESRSRQFVEFRKITGAAAPAHR